MLKVYLDTCCYNRPYDDQTQMRINLETQAKLYIQELIKENKLNLVTSYVLDYENSNSKYYMKMDAIKQFMNTNSKIYVGSKRISEVEKLASEIQETGIKEKDSLHIACAIIAECDYFVSTDDRLLKYKTDKIKLVTPMDFITKLEE